MFTRALFAAASFLFLSSPAMAAPLVKDGSFNTCGNVPACLQILERSRPKIYRLREWDDLKRIAEHLQTFGDAAKRELLARASGPDTGWKDLAGEILWHWQGLTDADIPQLQSAIHTREGEHIAVALASIGTPAAMQALLKEVLKGTLGADEPLAKFGTAALPYLFEGLKTPAWQDAAYVVQLIDQASPIAPEPWAAIARDTTRGSDERVAALRGLSVLADVPDALRDSLLSLTVEDDAAVQADATRFILVLAGTVPPGALARSCPLRTDPYTSLPNLAWEGCREQFAAHGAAALPFGAGIAARFLTATNAIDRADGATMLGFIGYEPAIPDLIAKLTDKDWRVSFASIRALGWLGAKDAIPALEQVSATHWFAEIRNYSSEVVAALRSPVGRMPRPEHLSAPYDEDRLAAPRNAFEVGPLILSPRRECVSGRWNWKGVRFSPLRQRRLELQDLRGLWGDGTRAAVAADGSLPPGELIGTDIGRWGGQLFWKPARGEPQVIRNGNVVSLTQVPGGAIAIFGECCRVAPRSGSEPGSVFISNGPTGYGYALLVSRDGEGNWVQKEIARLPEGLAAFHVIGPDAFVAWSAEDAIVFDTKKILGVAACVGG